MILVSTSSFHPEEFDNGEFFTFILLEKIDQA
jgi:hypothetical protein